MNNQPKIEAYRSFYEQGKELYNKGDIKSAREAFLKACELANDIAVNSTSVAVQTDYHNNVLKILEFLKKDCIPKKIENVSRSNGEDEKTKFDAVLKSEVTFDDVAGLDDVKAEIKYSVLEPLKNPELAKIYKIEPGAKILLYGPPGTGKTFIAKAIAGEIDAPFYAINCSDLVGQYLGESSKRINDLFDEALKNEKVVIFFDEIDALASQRGNSTDGADQEINRAVATFLTRLDGFKKIDNKMVLLIAATNRPWSIDKAMLRGGRFATHIYVSTPDQKAREFLVSKVLSGIPINDDVDVKSIAMSLEGFGGADITKICNDIKSNAYRRALESGTEQNINTDDCTLAINNKPNLISDEDIKMFEEFKEKGRI